MVSSTENKGRNEFNYVDAPKRPKELKCKIHTTNANGKKYNVIGEIGLSHTAIDITDSDVKIGDVASVEISPLMVNPNVPRIYK